MATHPRRMPRIDELARTLGTRRGFIAALAALAAGVAKVRPVGAQGMCSSAGGMCVPGMGCCPGHACTFEYNAWVGRCARLNPEEGGQYPLDTPAQIWAERIVDRAGIRRGRLERRRELRRDRRRRNRR
ncbi:MAG: hypothetical protein ACKOWF_02505 [Chloroflexota bacterium]